MLVDIGASTLYLLFYSLLTGTENFKYEQDYPDTPFGPTQTFLLPKLNRLVMHVFL